MVVFLCVHIALVQRLMRRDGFKLPAAAIMLVVVKRRTHVIQHQYQHQQPARKPPCAAHSAGAAA